MGESSIKAVWSSKALLLYDLQRYDEALKCFDKLTEFDSNNSALWAVRGRILNDLQRYDEAIVSLDRLLQLTPNHASGWNNKGVALLKKGKYDEAIECFEKSMKLDPTNKTFSSNKLYATKLHGNRLVKLKEEHGIEKIKAKKTLSSNYKGESLVKSEFEAKAQVVESYIKENKDFNIVTCAKLTGFSINEIRTIIEYLIKKVQSTSRDMRLN